MPKAEPSSRTAAPSSHKLFISTGCSSSDVLVAPLVAELFKRGVAQDALAVGGEPLRDVGARLLFDSTPLSTIGTAHGVSMFIRSGLSVLRTLREIDRQFKTNPPSLAILVDNAGINFRVLALAHKHRIPVLYYIPPELWSVWGFELAGVKRAKPRIAAIFESQMHEYRELGLEADWIGHPIIDLIDQHPRAPQYVGESPVISLFPGSRRQEVKQLVGPMLDAARLLYEREPKARFIMCAANPLALEIIQNVLPSAQAPVELRYREAHAVLSQSHLALACSGTVTLEATLLGVPMIAMYRLAGVLDNLVQKIVLPMAKHPYFSLPNVLTKSQVVPELNNRDVNGPRLCQEAMTLLRDAPRRAAVLEGLAKVRPILGNAGAVQRAADLAEQMIREKAATSGARPNSQAA